jgi:hypothetical protein
MKTLLFLLLLIPSIAMACDNHREIYVKIGTGYKVDQDRYFNYRGVQYKYLDRDPYSARFEIGIEQGRWTYGVSHHSQWASGFPFNDRGEPYKTEVFIDYRYGWEF